MFDANEVINGLYGFVYDENGKQMQETKAFEANVDYDKEEVLQAGKLIVYGNICLKQFPKHERYALASEIRLCMYRILGIVIETNHKHYKKTTLTELDIEVDKLRSYLRLSANPELKYLSVDKYGNWAAMVDEIGRMVGGWIQSVSK